MKKAITIYDIAREAKVSPATVSRVLSENPAVRPSTRAKVLSIIDELHYLPDISAQRLNSRENHTIGIITPSVKNPYFSTLFSAVNDTAIEHGYSTWLHQFPSQNNIVSVGLVKTLINQRLSGVIISGGFSENELSYLRHAVSMLQEYMPVVTISSPVQDIDCLVLSNDLSYAIEHIVKHLHTLGHTKIAFLGGSGPDLETFSRGRAFLNTLQELDLPDIKEYHSYGGFDVPSSIRSLSAMLNSLSKENYPTALVCFNDLVAIGALQELSRRGLSVPKDIAVTGCDNIFFSQYTSPPLTTIDLKPEVIASDATEAIITSPDSTRQNLIQHYEAPLVIRKSCGLNYGTRKFSNE